MKYLLIVLVFFITACNNSESLTSTSSSDSSIQAIDPSGNIRDTAQYNVDTTDVDSSGKGLTH